MQSNYTATEILRVILIKITGIRINPALNLGGYVLEVLLKGLRYSNEQASTSSHACSEPYEVRFISHDSAFVKVT